jgi:hypothetical protein
MASTRSTTGHSKPRVVATISTEPSRKRTTTTKKTKANTSKPRSTAGVIKKRAPATHHKRKPSVKDKVEGAVEKVIGKIEGKPGKVGAGTKKIHGTDGQKSRSRKVVV